MSSGDIAPDGLEPTRHRDTGEGVSIRAPLGAALSIRFLRGEWPRSCDRKRNLEFEHTLFEFRPIKTLKGQAFAVRNAC
jgi:hypothetical protein